MRIPFARRCLYLSDEEKVLRIALSSSIETLNPMKDSNEYDSWIINNVCLSMVESISMGASYNPSVATSWENPDDYTWVFHIRDDLYWHTNNEVFNGELVQVKAPELVEIIKYYMDGDNGYLSASSLAVIESVTAPDDFTVEIKTYDVCALFLSYISGVQFIPMKAIEAGWDFSTYPIGCGPYEFVSYSPDEGAVLKKNENYPIEPANDYVKYYVIPDGTSRAVALLNDEIDIIGTVAGETFVDIVADENMALENGGAVILFYIGLNCSDPLFQDADIRRALQMGFDAENIVKVAYEDASGVESCVRGYGPITPVMPGNDDENWKTMVPEYDPEGAKAILESKGWALNSDGIYEKDGQTFSFKLQTSSSNNQRLKICTMIATQLQAIGIDCQCTPTEGATLNADITLPSKQAWMVGGTSSITAAQSLFHSAKISAANNCYYENAEMEALIEQAFSTIDGDARAALITEAMNYPVQDAVHLLDTYYFNKTAYNKNVVDYVEGNNYLGNALCNTTRNVTVNK